ncbi:hypothetical protein OF83DRAFT_1065581 [Amylostereum chailletii]|nr:hypothetical protein OF83DRAFT_1065581 [Amylostereum chailletii]
MRSSPPPLLRRVHGSQDVLQPYPGHRRGSARHRPSPVSPSAGSCLFSVDSDCTERDGSRCGLASNRIYPTIDPQAHFDTKTFRGKTVLITGASRGIGQETALFYARAGASLVLVARQQATLDHTRDIVLQENPGAQILAIPVDVKDWKESEAAVNAAVERFGGLDVVVANAGTTAPMDVPTGEKDPVQWWNTFEVNLYGVFNFVRPAIPHLQKTEGYIVAVSSGAAQCRIPFASDYCISKHALGRFVELVSIEYPTLKIFSLHPGAVSTQIFKDAKAESWPVPDAIELPAATMLYLTSGRADWLSGRFVSANWDLGEVERDWKDKVVEKGALVSKLHIP